jgi:hypothetical protein
VQRLPQAGELLSPAPEYWLGCEVGGRASKGPAGEGHHLLLSP